MENPVRCLANFKAMTECNNSDFNSDELKQYEAVREAMTRVYEREPTCLKVPSSCRQQPLQNVEKLSFNRRLNCERGK